MPGWCPDDARIIGSRLDSNWMHIGSKLDYNWIHTGLIMDSSWIKIGLKLEFYDILCILYLYIFNVYYIYYIICICYNVNINIAIINMFFKMAWFVMIIIIILGWDHGRRCVYVPQYHELCTMCCSSSSPLVDRDPPPITFNPTT